MAAGHMHTYDRLFECRTCLTRVHPASYRAACPECGGSLRNVAVPRE